MTWRERMVDFLFPPKCPFCRRVTEGQRVCPQCEKALPWTEGKDREQTLPGGLRCASPLWYEDLAREGILRFKFHGGAGAEVLGALLAELIFARKDIMDAFRAGSGAALGMLAGLLLEFTCGLLIIAWFCSCCFLF